MPGAGERRADGYFSVPACMFWEGESGPGTRPASYKSFPKHTLVSGETRYSPYSGIG